MLSTFLAAELKNEPAYKIILNQYDLRSWIWFTSGNEMHFEKLKSTIL